MSGKILGWAPGRPSPAHSTNLGCLLSFQNSGQGTQIVVPNTAGLFPMRFLRLPSSAPLNTEKIKVDKYDREREEERDGGGETLRETKRGLPNTRQEEGSVGLIPCCCEFTRILSKFCTRTLLREMRPGAGSAIAPLLYFEMLHSTFHLFWGLSVDLDPLQPKPWLWLGASEQAGC